jgi:hypothetical protein
METITVARALSDIKLLDARIEKKIESACFVEGYQKMTKKLIKHPISKEDFEKNALAEYDSIVDLITRRDKIKSAILLSNATAKVKINGEEKTVIEAIEKKQAIKHEKKLLMKMRLEYSSISNTIERNEAALRENINKMLQQSISDERIRSKEDYERLAKPFREDNELVLVDPLKIRAKIDELDLKIDKFMSDIDFVLSESNSITKIEI